MSAFTLATYNLQVFGTIDVNEDGLAEPISRLRETDKRVLSNLPAMLEAVEEDLTSLLPEGYSAKVTEWNQDDGQL